MTELLYRFTCDECGAVATQSFRFNHSYYLPAPNPSIPDSWNLISNQMYCSDHRVSLKIETDGKETVEVQIT